MKLHKIKSGLGGYDEWYCMALHCAKRQDATTFQKLFRTVPSLGNCVIAPTETPAHQLYRSLKQAFVTVDKRDDNCIEHLLNGKLHCEDGPALQRANGCKQTIASDGSIEREFGDEFEKWTLGDKEWWVNGLRHREDGPAIERADGTKVWCRYGKYHRKGGRPALEMANGDKWWVLDGQLHSETKNGPSRTTGDGSRFWYREGAFPSHWPRQHFTEEQQWCASKTLHRIEGPAVETGDGCRLWYHSGKLHREDGPAVEMADGTKSWYQNNNLYRLERADGTKEWYRKNKLHRVGRPAIERADGTTEWYCKGKRHREDGPAIECADGTKQWYFKGQRHRIKGPAIVESDGTKKWYQNDKLHRLNGPAIEHADGSNEFYTDGLRRTCTHVRKKKTRGPLLHVKFIRWSKKKLFLKNLLFFNYLV